MPSQAEPELWQTLVNVTRVEFTASSKRKTGWNGFGCGKVESSLVDNSTMVFHETGTWKPDTQTGAKIEFSNIYRWKQSKIGFELEHLRFGEENPVYLVHLIQDENDPNRWTTKEPHLCNEDLYTATVELNSGSAQVQWTIKGPKKDELLSYLYS